MVTVLAMVALMMATRAENERALAVSRRLVAEARAQFQVDPELGLLLAREAYAAMPNDETEAVLRQAVADSHIRVSLPRAEHPITGVAFSSDGEHLVTSGWDGMIRVWDWDAERGAGIRLRRSFEAGKTGDIVGSIYSPVFSPDNRHIAMISQVSGVLVWDWAGRGEPVKLGEISGGWFRSIAFSPDGQRLAAGAYGVIQIWNLDRALLTTEAVLSTGKGRKVLVPAENLLDLGHLDELVEIALASRPRPDWEGGAWTAVDRVPSADLLRHALLVPRWWLRTPTAHQIRRSVPSKLWRCSWRRV